MRVLIDECVNGRVSVPIFRRLAQAVSVETEAPGANDTEVLELARRMDRILVTEDYGFGQLIYAERLPPPRGVILVALRGKSEALRRTRVEAIAAEALERAEGAFVVVEYDRLRVRALP